MAWQIVGRMKCKPFGKIIKCMLLLPMDETTELWNVSGVTKASESCCCQWFGTVLDEVCICVIPRECIRSLSTTVTAMVRSTTIGFPTYKLIVHSTGSFLGLMIILPNLQDKASCKYKVLQVHTEMAMYPKYQRMESGIETYKIKNEVEGNYKTIESLTKPWQK